MECTYAKEPFDVRLMILRLLRLWWMPVLGMIAGSLLAGGIYFVWAGIINWDEEYLITSMYFVEYGTDSSGDEYTYINGSSWNDWVTSDYFEELMDEELGKLGADAGDLWDSGIVLSADLLSNLNMPVTTVTASREESAVIMNTVLQMAMVDFGEMKSEIVSVEVIDTGEPERAARADRIVPVSIVGAAAGLLLVLFVMFVIYCMSDAVWVPETFSFRFGIPTAGFIAEGEQELSDIDAANLEYIFRDADKIAVTGGCEEIDLKRITDILQKTGKREYVPVECPVRDDGKRVGEGEGSNRESLVMEELRDADAILLVFKAGPGVGRSMLHLLEIMKIQDCRVAAALMCDADRRLLRAYYWNFGSGKGKKA